MHFQIRTAVSENGETDRVRLGKSVKRKRRDRLNNLVDLVRGNAFSFHCHAQFCADFVHPFLGAMKTQRAAKFLGLITRKIRHHHRNFQHLLLE